MRVSLRTQLGLTLFLAVATFLVVDDGLRRRAFSRDFVALEVAEAEVAVAEVRVALEELSRELSASARRTRADGTLPDEVVRGVDLVLQIGSTGVLHERSIVDPQSRRPLEVREVPLEGLAPSHPILVRWAEEGRAEGIVETRHGPLVIGSVERALDEERRLVVLGRFLTGERVRALGERVGRALEIGELYPRDGESTLAPDVALDLGEGRLHTSRTLDGGTVTLAALEDLRGLPLFGLRLESGPGLWTRLERFELLTSAAVAILFPLVLLVLLQLVVTGPLGRLTALASRIGESDDASLRTGMDRGDEIGTLSRSFDAMLDEIERARAAETHTARVVGRSEIAVSFMHNVGNLVNSAKVSSSLLRDRAALVDGSDLRTILETLRAHEGELDRYLSEDPQGRHLLAFFEAAVPSLEEAARSVERTASDVLESVEGMSRLVRSLEENESDAELVERVDLGRELRLAVQAVFEDDDAPDGIRVDVAAENELSASVDRERLHRVMATLLSNARDAVANQPDGRRRVRAGCARDDSGRATITVADSGPGVDPSHESEIFSLGFTTKPDGSGLGLHLASLAATELGGRVRYAGRSEDGGATFTFELSLERGNAARAA